MKPLPCFMLILILPLLCPAEELSLEKALSLTLEQGESVLLKRSELRSARFDLAGARSRALPSLELESSASWMINPPEGITVEAGSLGEMPNPEPPPDFFSIPSEEVVFLEDAENTYFKLSVVLTQPLFTCHKIKNSVDIAGSDLEIVRWELIRTEREVRREVIRAYFSTLLALESRRLLEEARDVMEEVVQDKQESYEAGIVNWLTVLEGKSRLAEIERRVWEAAESYQTGLEALSFFTGLDSRDLRLVTPFREELPRIDVDALQRGTVDGWPEREILKEKVFKARKNLAVKKGGGLFKPDLSFIIQWDITGRHIPFTEEDWTRTWNHNLTLSLGTSVVLFDSLSSHWKVKSAAEELNSAVLGLTQIEKSLALKLRQAVRDVRVGYYSVLEKESRLFEAEELYKNVRVSYENELITREEERQARVFLTGVLLDYRLTLFEYEMALAELGYLTGKELAF